MPKKFILDAKARKDLCCRVPRLLADGKTDAAKRCVDKYKAVTNSPTLHGYRIAVAEELKDTQLVRSLFEDSPKILNRAKKTGPDEIPDYLTYLFSFYVARKRLKDALSVLEAGKAHGLDKANYGMLWVRFCDRAGKVKEGVAAMEAYFSNKKKLSPREIDILRSQYPKLAKSKSFERLFGKWRPG